MAKYTVGQRVWFQSQAGDNNIGDAFVMPDSPLTINGEIVKAEGTNYTIHTENFGDVETTEQRINEGETAYSKIQKMREEQAEWDAKHATEEDIHANRV